MTVQTCRSARSRPPPSAGPGRATFARRRQQERGLETMAAARKKSTGRRKAAGRKAAGRKRTAQSGGWSAHVTKHSNALDLEKSIFKSSDPHRIALSLKRSAERST